MTHANTIVYRADPSAHFHEDSLAIVTTVAIQGIYIRAKSMKQKATRGVNTFCPIFVPEEYVCFCKALHNAEDSSSASLSA